jgi:polar amino acid transport system permease protein
MLDRIIEEAPRFFTYYNGLFLLKGMWATFILSAVGCVVGLVAGFVLAVVRRTKGRILMPVRLMTITFVEFFRRVPVLIVLLLIFFTFNVLKVDLSVFNVAVVAMCLIATAFIAEIIRSGLNSVHHNQWDAAAALNFNMSQTLFYVIVPQAWKVILLPVFIFFIMFIKESALASQLGVVELLYTGKVLNSKGFSAALVYGTILVLYFILSYPLARLGGFLEKRLALPRNH